MDTSFSIRRGFSNRKKGLQQTCLYSLEMLGGQGPDFLRGVAFWSIRSSGLLRWFWQVQHFVWPGITFSWQVQHFRDMDWKKCKTHLVRGRQLCTQRSIIEGSLAELLRFWCCQLQTLRKSGKIVSFLTLPSSKLRKPGKISAFLMLSKSKTEGVSQNGFVSCR